MQICLQDSLSLYEKERRCCICEVHIEAERIGNGLQTRHKSKKKGARIERAQIKERWSFFPPFVCFLFATVSHYFFLASPALLFGCAFFSFFSLYCFSPDSQNRVTRRCCDVVESGIIKTSPEKSMSSSMWSFGH